MIALNINSAIEHVHAFFFFIMSLVPCISVSISLLWSISNIFFWICQVITTTILWIRHENWLVNLSIKRIWQIIYTYWGFVHYNFVCFFISATRVHPSSNFRNGCHLPSKIWDGKDSCFCSFNSPANWSCSWSSCCSRSLPHERTSLSGMSALVWYNQ